MRMKTKQFFSVLALDWMLCIVAGAQNWQPTVLTNSYYDRAAMSADGCKQTITSYVNSSYYFSTNYGETWTSNFENSYPESSYIYLAASAHGSIVLAAGITNLLFVSTNSGVGWNSNAVPGVAAWGAVTCSADGGKLFAAAGGSSWPAGPIYSSTNLGSTWNLTGAPTNVWTGLAVSADGNKLCAVSGGGYEGVICTSTNGGATWSQVRGSSNYWTSVACSADGSHLAAVSFRDTSFMPGHIYTSTDSGLTWKSSSLPADSFVSVAVSADGSRLLAGASAGAPAHLYFSTDYGVTWSSNNIPPNGVDVGVSMSADGGVLMAVSLGDRPYEARSIVSPVLSVNPSGQSVALGWTVPSTNFILQQSADLVTWAAVTNVPVLNLTNLQEQVAVTATNGAAFYRLTTP